MTDALKRLSGLMSLSDPTVGQLGASIEALQELCRQLAGANMPGPTHGEPEPLGNWSTAVDQHLDRLQQEMRILRRSASLAY